MHSWITECGAFHPRHHRRQLHVDHDCSYSNTLCRCKFIKNAEEQVHQKSKGVGVPLQKYSEIQIRTKPHKRRLAKYINLFLHEKLGVQCKKKMHNRKS
ncbi:hypothetical protein CDAR_529241 [Caerostris darwini]|uniref:Uncharacterized protein n=1 Tax=Caerostris darwini TaxID=1538125 RepID=A0AAV4TXE7_9ARAC|nr:hypothetical protein CDAR_529241 [Caerostris darwini]